MFSVITQTCSVKEVVIINCTFIRVPPLTDLLDTRPNFSFPTGLILPTLGPFNVFILFNGWICLHGVSD